MSRHRYFNTSSEPATEGTTNSDRPALSSNQRFRQLFQNDRGRGRPNHYPPRRSNQSDHVRHPPRSNGRSWNDSHRQRSWDDEKSDYRDNRYNRPSRQHRGFVRNDRDPGWDHMHTDYPSHFENSNTTYDDQQRDNRDGLGSTSRAVNLDDDHDQSALSARRRHEGRGTMVDFTKRDYGGKSSEDVSIARKKRRKRVIGGRIPEYENKIEYKAETLFCEVCNEDYRDDHAQLLHLSSKKHQKNLAYMQNSKTQQQPRNEEVADYSAEQIQQRFKESKFPPQFKEWANRSMEAAKQESEKHNDPLISHSVNKEIIAVFMLHEEQCTLRKISWSRYPIATGENYRGTQVKRYDVKMITEEDAAAADKRSAQSAAKDEATAVEPASADAEPIAVEDGNHFVSGGVEGASSRNEPEQAAQAQDGSGSGMDTEATNGNGGDADDTPEIAQVVEATAEMGVTSEEQEARRLPMGWRVNQTSVVMKTYYACVGERGEEVAKKTKSFAPRLTKSENGDESGGKSLETIMEQYKTLRSKFNSKEFVYKELRDGLLQVFEWMTKRGTRKATGESCLQMINIAAIGGQEWDDLITNSKRLIRAYKGKEGESMDSAQAAHVAYWLMSWLFRPSRTSGGKGMGMGRRNAGALKMMDLAENMRDFPRSALEDVCVFEAVRVFRAFMSNDYAKFFGLYKDGGMHGILEGRSQFLMDEMAETVRERAIVTMTMRSCRYDDVGDDENWGSVYPHNIDLGYVMNVLGWDRAAEGEEDAALEEAKEFISNLSQKIVIHGDEVSGRHSLLLCNKGKALVTSDQLVNVDMLIRYGRAVGSGGAAMNGWTFRCT